MYSGRRAAAATAPANGSAAASTTTRGGARGGTSAASAGSNNNSQQQQFQPKLIASQIVALQCLHYFVWTVFLQINAVLYGNSLTIDRIFTDDYVRLWQWQGWPDALAILLSAVVGSILLVLIVEKSKKCLDFSATLFLLHIIITTWYSGHFPRRAEWWIVHIAATIGMIVLGEYLCSRRELDDIPLLTL